MWNIIQFLLRLCLNRLPGLLPLLHLHHLPSVQVYSLHMLVHFSWFTRQSGSLQARAHLQDINRNTASGAGEPRIHSMDRLPLSSVVHPCTGLWIWNYGLTHKAASPYCSLVVRTKNMHAQTVFAWRQLAGFYLSPFCIEEVVVEFIDLTDCGCRCIHATQKLLYLIK